MQHWAQGFPHRGPHAKLQSIFEMDHEPHSQHQPVVLPTTPVARQCE